LSAALIRAGIVGTVKEVHVWTNRPVWPQSYNLKVSEPPKPDHVHWNEWIGPAKIRPYSPDFHPFKWRGFWDFGTGALGDMCCHTLNMSYMALDLKNPTSVEATTKPHDGKCYPASSVIRYEFPAIGSRPALSMFWYDGGEKPLELLADCPKEKVDGREMVYGSGALIIGDKGKFFSPGDYGGEVATTGIVVDGDFINQRRLDTKPEYIRSPGHFKELTDAIRGNGRPISNFEDYAGGLTETTLLGNLAVWTGGRIEWDAVKMEATNNRDEAVRRIVRHEYLNGHTIHSPA
jgi:predicted dehydrogenase